MREDERKARGLTRGARVGDNRQHMFTAPTVRHAFDAGDFRRAGAGVSVAVPASFVVVVGVIIIPPTVSG
jgi:hypothetical protein